jgi:hypothetical protein
MYELLLTNSSFKRIFIMASFSFQKSATTVSFLAALLSLSVATQAQAVNDFGELLIEGQISNTTCVLQLGDPQSTGAGKKTMNLGTFSTSVAGAGAAGSGASIGTAQSIVLSLKAADGTACTFTNAANWDVGINISPTNYETVSGVTVLKSTAASGQAAGVGVKISTTKGAVGTIAGLTAVNFAAGNGTYGTLLSGAASSPGVLPAEVIALTAQMVRGNAAAVTAGVFTHSIPMNVWYK